jgi:trehalose/maltose transport system substrate-binding protein
VNNPAAIHSWQRAAHWIGWISPPGVFSYWEWDAINTFKTAKNSAFLRTWTSDYLLSKPVDSPVNTESGITSLLGPGVLGGSGLAVSRSSAHQAESIKLVQFLVHREQQLEASRTHSQPISGPVLYALPAVLKAYSPSSQSSGASPGRAVVRPSTITGENYDKVSRAYFEAIYSVLTRKISAQEAAAQLESKLTRIIGSEHQQ